MKRRHFFKTTALTAAALASGLFAKMGLAAPAPDLRLFRVYRTDPKESAFMTWYGGQPTFTTTLRNMRQGDICTIVNDEEPGPKPRYSRPPTWYYVVSDPRYDASRKCWTVEVTTVSYLGHPHCDNGTLLEILDA
jgi:hypothetical protein